MGELEIISESCQNAQWHGTRAVPGRVGIRSDAQRPTHGILTQRHGFSGGPGNRHGLGSSPAGMVCPVGRRRGVRTPAGAGESPGYSAVPGVPVHRTAFPCWRRTTAATRRRPTGPNRKSAPTPMPRIILMRRPLRSQVCALRSSRPAFGRALPSTRRRRPCDACRLEQCRRSHLSPFRPARQLPSCRAAEEVWPAAGRPRPSPRPKGRSAV